MLPFAGSVTGQVLENDNIFYGATNAGQVVAFTADGYILWQDDFGQLAQTCPQLTGYGLVSTGVIDDSTSTLYVMDAFGRLHALDLATGAEEQGWPVRVFSDFRKELDWGVLTLADGNVYVPTGAYCDASSLGGVYSVSTTTQSITAWIDVPQSEGGGGGPWGWGGLAYDADDDVLYAATSGAFGGGTWHKIFTGPVLDVLRVSTLEGFISVGDEPGACMCATRQFWTMSNGAHWHETTTLPANSSRAPNGTIVAVAPIAGSVAALISSRVKGEGWDTAPRVLLVKGASVQTVTLPTVTGHPLVQSLQVAGSKLTVTATDFVVNPSTTTTWVSSDGGATWSVG